MINWNIFYPFIKAILFVLLLGLPVYGIAQEQEKSGESLGNAAANATNPLAFVTKFQVQPNFAFS